MLDAQFICEHLDAVKANCVNRNVKPNVDPVGHLENERKRLAQETQQIQQRQNELSKLIPKEKDKVKKDELVQQGRKLREQVAALEAQSKQVETDLRAILSSIPNMTHPDAPV